MPLIEAPSRPRPRAQVRPVAPVQIRPSRGIDARRAARRRARTRVRVLLAAVLAIAATVITLTDLNGRSEVGQSIRLLASTQQNLGHAWADLFGTQGRTNSTYQAIEGLEISTLNSADSVTSDASSTTAADIGIFFDGINTSTLDDCLVGVVQSLDQIDVGQTTAGLTELNAMGPICDSVQP